MRTRVKDYIEVSDYTSLERLITTLTAIRDSLPETAEPELKMRGDDVFGRRLSISYWRELSREEQELDAKYSSAAKAAGEEIAALAAKLDDVPFERAPKKKRAA
ncbi:hypothetical protein [Sphingomonas sp. LHG3406-1]|uniref:hypothetical protein n=1 Tax=Sphingomonas sp. LHG3406-1 TaxID=2804617 RepID=UPI0026322C3D|nr:hypothetical protein [Sphingomonas sp. LHG3406-1]